MCSEFGVTFAARRRARIQQYEKFRGEYFGMKDSRNHHWLKKKACVKVVSEHSFRIKISYCMSETLLRDSFLRILLEFIRYNAIDLITKLTYFRFHWKRYSTVPMPYMSTLLRIMLYSSIPIHFELVAWTIVSWYSCVS